MMDDAERTDVVVVGAGLAGVVASRALRRAGKRVIVFEGRDRVGGRLLTSVGASGLAMDRGGQWIGPGQHRMLKLVTELGVETHPTTTAGKTAFELSGTSGASRMGFPLTRPMALIGVALGMSRIDKLVRRFKDEAPWSGAASTAQADMSVEAFLRNSVRAEGAREVLRSAFEGVFCRDADQISMHLALYAIGCCGGFAHMQAVKGGAQEQQLSAGAGALVERLATELSDCIRLSSPVTRVERNQHGVAVHAGSTCAHAQQVIIAVPPPLIARMRFDPPLSPARWETLTNSKMGHVIKYNLVYERPFWRTAGLAGALWSTSGPVNVCYDTTPSGTELGVLSALSVARSAEELGRLPHAERRQAVLDAMVAHWGPEARKPVEFSDMVWADEPLSGGGYSVTLPPGGFALGPAAFRNAEGPIHFAGTETASEYPGYMEGAVESGERAADEVIAKLAE